jgi:hypothetical protein
MRNSSLPRVRARLGAVPLAGVVATLAVTSLLETKPPGPMATEIQAGGSNGAA